MNQLISRKSIATLFVPLGLLLFLELIPLFGTQNLSNQVEKPAGTSVTLREQADFGAIDEEAVMVAADGDVERSINLCENLSKDIWILLLFSYIGLLTFNFHEQFRSFGRLRFWRFEILLSILFLGVWYFFDACHQEIWFPVSLVKSGLLVFLFFEVQSLYQDSQNQQLKEETRE